MPGYWNAILFTLSVLAQKHRSTDTKLTLYTTDTDLKKCQVATEQENVLFELHLCLVNVVSFSQVPLGAAFKRTREVKKQCKYLSGLQDARGRVPGLHVWMLVSSPGTHILLASQGVARVLCILLLLNRKEHIVDWLA